MNNDTISRGWIENEVIGLLVSKTTLEARNLCEAVLSLIDEAPVVGEDPFLDKNIEAEVGTMDKAYEEYLENLVARQDEENALKEK